MLSPRALPPSQTFLLDPLGSRVRRRRPAFLFLQPASQARSPGASPALDKIARGVEFQILPAQLCNSLCVAELVAAPDSSGLMSRGRLYTQMWSSLSSNHHGNPLHEPFVWQRLWPSGVDFINGRVLRSHHRNNYENQESGEPDRYGRRIVPSISNPHHMFLRLMCTQDSAGNCAESS